MKQSYFPLYEIAFRQVQGKRSYPNLKNKKSFFRQVEFNVPIDLTKLEIYDFLKKIYPSTSLDHFNFSNIRTLIQKKDRKLSVRNTYLQKSYKKAILTTKMGLKKESIK